MKVFQKNKKKNKNSFCFEKFIEILPRIYFGKNKPSFSLGKVAFSTLCQIISNLREKKKKNRELFTLH